MPTQVYPDINKASDLAAQDADFIPRLWAKGVEISEQTENFFEEFEGAGPMSPIQNKTDLSKGAGQKITFRKMAGLYGDGVIGDEIIGDKAESFRVGTSDLEVDYLRHATSHNMRTEDQTALLEELDAGIPVELGKWLGRKKTERLMMKLNSGGGADNYIFAGSKGSRELLRSADTISMDLITSGGQQLKTRGATPAFVGRSGKNPILRYIVVGVGEGLVSLKNSSDYKLAVREAGIRGADNVIFKGGFVDVDGNIIREFNPIDHDGYGPIGSAMNAKAQLGVAITAGSATFDLLGGGCLAASALTTVKYFEFFSNYAYRFTPADILAPAATDRYVLVYNMTGADAGKMGFYKYVTNNGNKLVISERLGSSIAGISNTTVGNVVWNTGVWANKHTDAHPAGSLVVETNSYGVPIGRSYILGARACLRGYGRFQRLRTEEKLDGDFLKKIFITSIFGQAPYTRADGKCPNFLCIEHALTYQGIAIPANIT